MPPNLTAQSAAARLSVAKFTENSIAVTVKL